MCGQEERGRSYCSLSLKIEKKKVKFAPGEIPAFVFCAKNFPETFENFFLFILAKRRRYEDNEATVEKVGKRNIAA